MIFGQLLLIKNLNVILKEMHYVLHVMNLLEKTQLNGQNIWTWKGENYKRQYNGICERTIKQKMSEIEKNDIQNNLFKQNNINGREALLDKVRNNQRKRMEAKFDFQLFNNLTATKSAPPCTIDNNSVENTNNNDLNNINIIEEDKTISSSNGEQMEWKQQTLPSKVDCKNEIETFTTKHENNEDISEQLEGTTTCFSCQRISDCLVLNVRSRMFRCLDCFQQQQKQHQNWCNNTTNNNINNNNENQNGFITTNVLDGLQQNIENKKKRVSPPFSALELASSPCELFVGGTKRTRVESEH
ncbi:hypothetical protein Mgra_00003543 [Meloidogyne graminicola]|uniref:Uncharacterized protein n=1 Tax=Meloidogyne graminicola TaxID=189291 RepID=A0A8S9ZV01_9BILA|nr:hypothetical protein Mgra_00003543 [Meloidogyne graminicola]